MSDNAPKAAAKAEAQAAANTFDLTVEEFCTNLSAADGRVEMIAAFCASERRAGRFKDSSGAFAGRFEAFVSAPA
jgi:hypothetical protein